MGINVFTMRNAWDVDKNHKNTLWRSTLILRVSMPAACALLMQASLQRHAPTAAIKCLRHFARRRAINRALGK